MLKMTGFTKQEMEAERKKVSDLFEFRFDYRKMKQSSGAITFRQVQQVEETMP
jgi:hypothetical protein